MKLYVIKMPDGTYFAQNNNKVDNTFRYTNDITKAHTYVSVQGIEKALGGLTYIFKGAVIIDRDNGNVVKYMRYFHNKLDNVKVLKETEKAIMIDIGDWLPKSQCEVIESEVFVSDWLWKQKFENKDCEVI